MDPVLRAGVGAALTPPAMAGTYLELLVPVATVVTPNLAEAAALTGRPVTGVESMAEAGAVLVAAGAACAVVTGGHLAGDTVVDVVCDRAGWTALEAPRIDTANTHGTGCTFAAAVAAHLARGCDVLTAARRAQRFVGRALSGAAAWRLGAGPGPLDQLGRG